jgi:hypothetical protein
MANVTLAPGASGNTGALAAANIFMITQGTVEFSTDGGTTWMPFRSYNTFQEPTVVFASGLTVDYRNSDSGVIAKFAYMAT